MTYDFCDNDNCTSFYLIGFSEAEIRFRHIDVKPTKAYDAKKKEKKKKLASKLQERRQQENTGSYQLYLYTCIKLIISWARQK